MITSTDKKETEQDGGGNAHEPPTHELDLAGTTTQRSPNSTRHETS